MDLKNILLLVFIIVLLYILVVYLTRDNNTLTGMVDGKTMTRISADSLSTDGTTASTSNFTYSIWFFVDDWNYKYGEPKILYGRMTNDGQTLNPCPLVVLGALENNLIITLQVYPGADTLTDISGNSLVHTCNVSNVPLQKWVNLLITTYGRSLDVYIDGKLVRTCVLPGVAKVDTSTDVYVTPKGGFSGWTALFQYWPNSTDPQEAWNIYKKGYGGNMFGNLGKYSVKVSLMEGDVEDASFEI